MRVKVCGITNLRDAIKACRLGADAVGFIFYEKSGRYVPASTVAGITRNLPPFVARVGVFVNEQPGHVRELFTHLALTAVQLHGDESPDYCQGLGVPFIKVFRVGPNFDPRILAEYRAGAFLLDTFRPNTLGGTGETFNWSVAVEAKQYGDIILSGGLRATNVGRAIKTVQPYGIDVCSGVERSVGQKDHEKLALFMKKARAHANQVIK